MFSLRYHPAALVLETGVTREAEGGGGSQECHFTCVGAVPMLAEQAEQPCVFPRRYWMLSLLRTPLTLCSSSSLSWKMAALQAPSKQKANMTP